MQYASYKYVSSSVATYTGEVVSCFRQTGGFGPSAQLWLTRERSEECPDRLYTDKHVMDSLCDTDAVQFVSPGPSLASVRPLFPL